MKLDRKSPEFQYRLRQLHGFCYKYIHDVLNQDFGGYEANGKNTFIQQWDMSWCDSRVGSLWVQVYSKGRRAYYAHEDLFKVDNLRFVDVNFSSDDFTKTRYMTLKDIGEATLESL